MNNKNDYFRIKRAIKYKKILKLSISLLLIFLLCSCNKGKGNVDGDIAVVNDGDSISEDTAYSNSDEVLTKVQDEIKTSTGLDNIEVSELFSIDNTYYVKVKIHDLMLHYEYIKAGEDQYDAVTAYTDRELSNIEEKISGDYYEIWRYENGDLKRILYNMEDVVHRQDDDKIIIDGAYNSYIIKLGTDNKGKEKILYECYYTDILNSDNGDFTCYINDFFSACVVDNKDNKIILNKYIDFDNEFSNENFMLDINRAYFPKRMQVVETGWIKNSNMAFFACYDMSHVFFVIDIDKKIVSQPNFTTGRGYEGFIDKDNGYIVSGDTYYALDTDTYMMEHMEKQYHYFYLINLYTSEKFEIAKTIRTKIEFKKEDEKTISYTASSGERIKADISDMIGKDSTYIKKGFKDALSSELSTDEADNIKLIKFNDIAYAVVDNGKNKSLIKYTENNKVNIIADKLDDINFSELGKYISLYNGNGDIIVLDSSGNKYLEDNVFNYISNNDTSNSKNQEDNNVELGVTVWGKSNDRLYILTKKDDMLRNIFEVNLADNSIRDLAYDIDCRYENIYIDISEGYAVYSTFPGHIFYSYDGEVNDDVCLYVKYFYPDEKVEIARAKGESINFYIFGNELEYYCRENDDVRGTYELDGDRPSNISQGDTSQQLLLNGISLTNDIIRSVYRREGNYTYEALLYAFAVNDDENNLYKGYFPFEEGKGFIFSLDKSKEVLLQVFGEKEYSFKDVFDYNKETDIYYRNLDFGWNTAYIAENTTADIIDDKLYTKFELINLWYDVEGDPVPTAIAECEITYSINKSNDKTYLQFESMETLSKLVN
ncbi:hypothetical protein HZF24_15715 [Sedimentibacter hydroxybenzoicus DSM 7310]|uniref:Uncharacterized protein n=1 Tax=Sedimentibacter hydroxybenzoicus DSM 7310 TaxID=1123245 RepID=A0A974GY02_SEDHY|nr:hypothetical protein [Sedimentibacter hydroxybenzoicus]NYB75595.1 hypothetical protein [Sedimentibacter hydroxybenzoicus DSM 7310]